MHRCLRNEVIMPIKKLDLKKEMKEFWLPPREPVIVKVPAMNFLMIDGEGDPNTAQQYQDAVQALYSVAYTIKFALKKSAKGVDYTVPPLEGLWWVDNMELFSVERKSDWKWTMMIMQPGAVTEALVKRAVEEAGKKKELPALSRLRFECFEEGPSAQIMHIGPYAAEKPTVARLHAFIQANGYRRRGKHHEIYLSDPRRGDPAKMKTVIRQPVERA